MLQSRKTLDIRTLGEIGKRLAQQAGLRIAWHKGWLALRAGVMERVF
jgi:hypothetical protein